jgi:hypothetical protein
VSQAERNFCICLVHPVYRSQDFKFKGTLPDVKEEARRLLAFQEETGWGTKVFGGGEVIYYARQEPKMKFTLGMIIQHKLGIPQIYAPETQPIYAAAVLEGVASGHSVQDMVAVLKVEGSFTRGMSVPLLVGKDHVLYS